MLTIDDFRGNKIAWGRYLDGLALPGMELREPEGIVRPLKNLEMVAITHYLRAQRRAQMAKEQQRELKATLEGEQFQRALRTALPKHIRPERMIRVVLAAMQQNQRLLECTTNSVLLSVMQAAAAGLEPDGGAIGHGYLVPFWNGKQQCYECKFVPGYRGLVKLARNSGDIADVWAEVVYKADEFSYELGVDQKLSHKRNDEAEDAGALKYAYAVARFRDGEKKFAVLNRREIEAIKQRTSSKNRDGEIVGPWVTDEAEMWKKTAVRRLAKQLPLAAETVFDERHESETVAAPTIDFKLPDSVPEAPKLEGPSPLEEAMAAFDALSDVGEVSRLCRKLVTEYPDYQDQIDGLAEAAKERIRVQQGARGRS